jgi:hypothetical protein
MSEDNVIYLEDVASRFRDLCTRQIEDLEDQTTAIERQKY